MLKNLGAQDGWWPTQVLPECSHDGYWKLDGHLTEKGRHLLWSTPRW